MMVFRLNREYLGRDVDAGEGCSGEQTEAAVRRAEGGRTGHSLAREPARRTASAGPSAALDPPARHHKTCPFRYYFSVRQFTYLTLE